ncbi:unnamed protein product [Phytophthora lilii]|uniref:Unnamed protein product n=1 Tax=Phytophthora lilii TaxID=2077276 RepID=A0A9W6TR00_9STRA|nr:unnamed protein product [Phytophthora lilii]
MRVATTIDSAAVGDDKEVRKLCIANVVLDIVYVGSIGLICHQNQQLLAVGGEVELLNLQSFGRHAVAISKAAVLVDVFLLLALISRNHCTCWVNTPIIATIVPPQNSRFILG